MIKFEYNNNTVTETCFCISFQKFHIFLQVQGTNDSSIVSKCAVSTLGYFHDDYLKHFVARQTRRAPLINRGYYVRAKAIDGALRCFLKSFQREANQVNRSTVLHN